MMVFPTIQLLDEAGSEDEESELESEDEADENDQILSFRKSEMDDEDDDQGEDVEVRGGRMRNSNQFHLCDIVH